MTALANLLGGYEAVLNCTQYYWNLRVMKAALAARSITWIWVVSSTPRANS